MKVDSSPAPRAASARAEAAAWVARLHGSGRSRALEAGFKRWLQADPEHVRAFEIATEAWEIGGSIPRGALPRIADPASGRRAPRALMRSCLPIAAALTTVVVGTLLYVNREQPAVTTNVGEQRMLTLDDGSRIFLNTDTRLFVQEEPARRHVRFDSGEALFDVTRNPARPFVVTVGDKEVVALGTSFVVRHDRERLAVTLVQGEVAVSPVSASRAEAAESHGENQDRATVLTPGQRLTFADDHPPKLDEPALEKVTAWRRGEVILEKTRLQDAADEMNRYSAVKIVIDDALTGDIRVSGIFRAGDSVRFAQAVGETYHLPVHHDARRIVISGSLR
jgi:transmembrane sensor